MTRKDYIAIAEALSVSYQFEHKARKELTPASDETSWAFDAAFRISQAMALDNPRFDRAHFLAVVRGERELTSRPKRKRDLRADCINERVYGVKYAR